MSSFCTLLPRFLLKQSFWVAEIVSILPGWEDPLILWSAFADICGMFKMHLLGDYRDCVSHFSEHLCAFQALKESEAFQILYHDPCWGPGGCVCPLFGQLTIDCSEPTHDAVALCILLLPEALKLVPFGNTECDYSLIRRIFHGLQSETASLCCSITL